MEIWISIDFEKIFLKLSYYSSSQNKENNNHEGGLNTRS